MRTLEAENYRDGYKEALKEIYTEGEMEGGVNLSYMTWTRQNVKRLSIRLGL